MSLLRVAMQGLLQKVNPTTQELNIRYTYRNNPAVTVALIAPIELICTVQTVKLHVCRLSWDDKYVPVKWLVQVLLRKVVWYSTVVMDETWGRKSDKSVCN